MEQFLFGGKYKSTAVRGKDQNTRCLAEVTETVFRRENKKTPCLRRSEYQRAKRSSRSLVLNEISFYFKNKLENLCLRRKKIIFYLERNENSSGLEERSLEKKKLLYRDI